MKVYFYSFSKRKKSTKQVTGSGLEKDVCWKEKTSIIKPSLITSFNPVGYNYVYIPGFSRYYFVSDIHTDTAGTFQIDLTEDELASHKTTIGSTSANILYATGSNKNIPDSRIPITANLLYDVSTVGTFDSGFAIRDPANGVDVVIGINGKGSFGPYLMNNEDQVKELLDGVDTYVGGITDVLDMGKQFIYGGSAAECLKSAIGLPVTVSITQCTDNTLENIVLGNYPCKDGNGNNIQGFRISKPIMTGNVTLTIPWISTDWKRISAYTDVIVYLPLIGCMSLPATELQSTAGLYVQYAVNVTSGDVSVQVRKSSASGKIVGETSGNIAVPIAYGSTGINTTKMTSGIAVGIGAAATAIVGAATGGIGAAGAVAIGGTIAHSASEIMQALGGTSSGSPGLGGGASSGLDREFHVWVVQKTLADTQNNFAPIMGKPYMGVATVGSFSGYVQTDGFQLAGGNVYDEERANINQMLDTGIYYE